MGDHIPEELIDPHTKEALISIETQPMLPTYFKYPQQIIHMSLIFSALHDHIIYIHLHRAFNLIPEHLSHYPLISSPHIFKAKRHYCVVIIGFLIFSSQSNLMVALESI